MSQVKRSDDEVGQTTPVISLNTIQTIHQSFILHYSLIARKRMEQKKNGVLPLAVIIMITLLVIYLLACLTSDSTKNGFFGDIFSSQPALTVPLLVSAQDQNRNQIPDSIDIVNGARKEVVKGTVYDDSYYQGYPPEGRGACTDVIWRALAAAGYDLKKMVDDDIKSASGEYGTTGANPDPNIDFRRVSNLRVFFARHGDELTTRIIPGDAHNLLEWQAGDIVVFGGRLEHIGIISDRRGRDGVPLMIHNSGPTANEDNYYLTNWPTPIIHHFRFIPVDNPLVEGTA